MTGSHAHCSLSSCNKSPMSMHVHGLIYLLSAGAYAHSVRATVQLWLVSACAFDHMSISCMRSVRICSLAACVRCAYAQSLHVQGALILNGCMCTTRICSLTACTRYAYTQSLHVQGALIPYDCMCKVRICLVTACAKCIFASALCARD